jgi:hypothetical protein
MIVCLLSNCSPAYLRYINRTIRNQLGSYVLLPIYTLAMLKSALHLTRTSIMSSGKVSAASTAAGRLSTIQRHLSSSGSGSSSNGKQVERMTVFGAGLMGAGIAQVGAQNGLKVSACNKVVRAREADPIRWSCQMSRIKLFSMSP